MLYCPKCKSKTKKIKTDYQMEIENKKHLMGDIQGRRCEDEDCGLEFYLSENMEEFVRRISIKSAKIFWERYSNQIKTMEEE